MYLVALASKHSPLCCRELIQNRNSRFPFWFIGHDFDSKCTSSWSLPILLKRHKQKMTLISGELHDLLHRCPEGSFGYKCRFRCHCVDDEPCNKITGTCYAGCRSGYWGPGCQLCKFFRLHCRHGLIKKK